MCSNNADDINNALHKGADGNTDATTVVLEYGPYMN